MMDYERFYSDLDVRGVYHVLNADAASLGRQEDLYWKYETFLKLQEARLGTLTGDKGLIGEGQIERFKGQVKETLASVSEMAESRSKDAAEAVKTKLGEESRRD